MKTVGIPTYATLTCVRVGGTEPLRQSVTVYVRPCLPMMWIWNTTQPSGF